VEVNGFLATKHPNTRHGRKKSHKKHRRQTAELKTRTRGQQKKTGNGGGGDSIPSYRAQDPVTEHTVHIGSGSGTYTTSAKALRRKSSHKLAGIPETLAKISVEDAQKKTPLPAPHIVRAKRAKKKTKKHRRQSQKKKHLVLANCRTKNKNKRQSRCFSLPCPKKHQNGHLPGPNNHL
jgi:hypothetical protein